MISLVSHDNHALSVECSCEARHGSSSCSLRQSLHRVTTSALLTIQGDSSQTDHIHFLWNGEIILNIITGKLLRILKYNSFEMLNHLLHPQSTPTHKLLVVKLNSQSPRQNKSHSKEDYNILWIPYFYDRISPPTPSTNLQSQLFEVIYLLWYCTSN